MPALEIVPISPTHPDLEGVLESAWPDDDTARAYHTPRAVPGTEAPHVWLARLEDRTVGFVARSASRWHPQALYPTVAVRPEARGQGIGRALWHTLERTLENETRTLQTALYDAQTLERAWLERRGFREIMRTHFLKRQASDISPEPFEQARRQALESGLTFSTLLERPDLADAVAQLQHRVYQAGHTFNPVPDLPLEALRAAWLREEVKPETLFLALEQGVPIGFAALYGQGQALELAYFGVDPEHNALEPGLSKALVGQALEWARTADAVLEGEFDSLNPSAVAVLQVLGGGQGEVWLTYRRAGT